MSKNEASHKFYSRGFLKNESPLAREIKILAEVEKIWILYDLDFNDSLDYEEVKLYLKEMAYPHLTLSDE